MTVNLSALAGAGQQFFDNNGNPLSGGKLYSYEAGTTTPQPTYTTAAGNIAHTNPIILNSAGRVATGEIWLTAGQNYKFVLTTSTDVTIATWDNITGINGTGIASNAVNVQYDPPFTGAVSTNVEAKLSEQASIKDFGAVGNGTADNSTAIRDALQSGAQFVYVPPGTYAMASNISAAIATDVTFYGHGKIIYTGSNDNVNPLITIETGNNSLTVDGLSFDGDDKIAAGLVIRNSATPDSNTLPNCTLSNNLLIRFRKNVAGVWSDGAYVTGSYQLVTIANNRVRLITRAAGVGVPGVSGTSGITVQQLSNTQFIRECLHYGNQYAAIFGDDLVASANNVDYDGFKFFAPAPSTASGQYVQSTLTSYGNVYRNCRGRALKIQAIGTVRDETIIRDSDYTSSIGSTEINFQYGIGMVSNCQFIYRPYNSGATSPIQTSLTLVSFFQGTDYGEDSGGAIVNGIQVLNSIPAGVGLNISRIVNSQLGFVSGSTELRPLVSVSNVSVNKNAVDWVATLGYSATTYGTIRLDNVVVPDVTYSVIGTNGTDTNFDIVATNVVNLNGVATPANAKPFVTSTSGTSLNYGGLITGVLNQGFIQTYAVRSDFNNGPLLRGGALTSQAGAAGAASVQSATLIDDAVFEFDSRFLITSRGAFIVSVNFSINTQGLFATGSNAIEKIAVTAGELFEVSAGGTNPDVDGQFNMWFTGGKLNVKNRLGSTQVVTVMFIG